MAKPKIEADESLAYEIAAQSLMGTHNTLIQRLGIPKDLVMRATAEGLGVMATNPDGTDKLNWLIRTMRSAGGKTREVYRKHPELADQELEHEANSSDAEDSTETDAEDSTDILTAAVQKMGAIGMTKNDVVPALVDFTATVAIALGGEDAVKACIIRLGDRIKDFHEGNFPLKNNKSE